MIYEIFGANCSVSGERRQTFHVRPISTQQWQQQKWRPHFGATTWIPLVMVQKIETGSQAWSRAKCSVKCCSMLQPILKFHHSLQLMGPKTFPSLRISRLLIIQTFTNFSRDLTVCSLWIRIGRIQTLPSYQFQLLKWTPITQESGIFSHTSACLETKKYNPHPINIPAS